MSELTRRILFAVVAAPAAVAIVYFGGAPLAALLGILAALGAWELYRIARAGGIEALETPGIVLAAAVPLVVHAYYVVELRRAGGEGRVGSALATGVVAVLAMLGAAIWARGVGGRPLASVAVTAFGVVYVGATLSFGYALRYHPYAVGRAAGTALVGLPLALTWATDIGAYAVGRLLGKRKLIPSVSPGKTVAGAVGALVVTVVVCWLYVRFVLRPYAQLALSPVAAVGIGLVVSVAAQIGDLAESLLKREAGVKDSSKLLPGHGGILDRLDSLFFVLPVVYSIITPYLLPAPL